MRSEYCGLVTEHLLGQTVSLCGWVQRRRDHGGVIFVDLRDREGLVQVVCDPDRAEMFKAAEGVRNEFCVQIKGVVRNRPEGTTNAGLPLNPSRDAGSTRAQQSRKSGMTAVHPAESSWLGVRQGPQWGISGRSRPLRAINRIIT